MSYHRQMLIRHSNNTHKIPATVSKFLMSEKAAEKAAHTTWRVRFDTIDEAKPGKKWQSVYHEHAKLYQRWYLYEGYKNRPDYRACRQKLRQYMPEIVGTYDTLCDLAGGSDWVSRFLSLYCPPRYITGCSQIVWPGQYGQPYSLIRNYDYHPQLLDGVIFKSAWNGKSVIAMTDCLWGVLDGMNEDGLAISLTFGGDTSVSEGFGIPLIIRYALEFCSTAAEAAEVFRRVPSHMTYNVTMLDKSGKFLTAYLTPNCTPTIRPVPVATNHQGNNYQRGYGIETQTVEREQLLNHCFADGRMHEMAMIDLFLHPPLYTSRYDNGFGTVFTSHYRPASGEIFYYWPYDVWDCSFDRFKESARLVNFNSRGAIVEKGLMPPFK